MRRRRPGHTLQPSALVHEALIRLIAAAWSRRTPTAGCCLASRSRRWAASWSTTTAAGPPRTRRRLGPPPAGRGPGPLRGAGEAPVRRPPRGPGGARQARAPPIAGGHAPLLPRHDRPRGRRGFGPFALERGGGTGGWPGPGSGSAWVRTGGRRDECLGLEPGDRALPARPGAAEAERGAFLDRASFGPEVRDQVARLLVGDAGAERGGFLRPPGVDPSSRPAVPDPHFAARRGFHLRCPQCQHAIEVVETRLPAQFTCEFCGTTIRTGPESTGPPGRGRARRSAGSPRRPAAGLRPVPADSLDRRGRIRHRLQGPRPADGPGRGAEGPPDRQPRLGQGSRGLLPRGQGRRPAPAASIVPIYEVGEVDGTPFIVSEFVEG